MPAQQQQQSTGIRLTRTRVEKRKPGPKPKQQATRAIAPANPDDPADQALAAAHPDTRKPFHPKREPVPSLVTNDEIQELERTMTAKQILLARVLGNTLYPSSKVDAYRYAYDYCIADNSPSLYSMSTAACNHVAVLLLETAVKAEIRRASKAALSNREALQERIGYNLLDLAECSRNEKTRLGALRTLGQTVHARSFAQAEPDSQRQAAHDAVAELLKRFTTAGAIDVQATPAEIED